MNNMTDELMTLEDIEEFMTGQPYAPVGMIERLVATARAAHEWRMKYDARKVEVAAIYSHNENLASGLADALSQRDILMKIINDDGSLETFEQHREILVDMRAAYNHFPELQEENEKLRAEIAELRKLLSIASTALSIADDWNLSEVQLDQQQAEMITNFAATDREDDEHPHDEGWVTTCGICNAIDAAIAAEKEQAK
jgi:hypothetical protein